MDERYLRFPRWLEVAGVPEQIISQAGYEGWVLFRRLVEEDLSQNLFPDWVDFKAEEIGAFCGLGEQQALDLFLKLGEMQCLRIREYGGISRVYQYRIPVPFPSPCTDEALSEALQTHGLPENPELWRYRDTSEADTKYERIVRLYEGVCGLKISGRIVEELAELAESYPYEQLKESFDAALKEGVTTLAWIRKHLKRLKKHERVQKSWGRPIGLELPEGYTIPSEGPGNLAD